MRSGIVLLVEDEPEVARLLMAVMELWGSDAFHAPTAREAIDFAALHPEGIALVVCDVNLQGASGPDVAERIRAMCPRTRMLFTSGSPFEDLCDRGLLKPEALVPGVTGFLQKPFLPRDLGKAIQRLCEPSSQGTQSAPATGVRYARAAY